MEPSPQQQHESPAKGAASASPAGSLQRFKDLARRLFAVDQREFQEALKKDEEKRRAKRGR